MSDATGGNYSGHQTVQDCLDRNGGSTTGFDYLRIGLAVAVVCWHSLETSYSDGTSVRVWHSARGIISFILPSFFALSGFLVAGSLVRTKSLVAFVTHRAIRIIPALSVEILLSALLLGPVLTTLPLGSYFRDRHFYEYFLNIIGMIHYILPGLFSHNPNAFIVNKSLWTIPYELECYLALIVIFLIGLVRQKWAFLAMVIALCVGMCVYVDVRHSPILLSVGPPGRLLVLGFLSGVALYLFRDVLVLSTGMFLCALALGVFFLSFPQLMFLSPLPVAYATVWLGLRTPAHIPVLMDGDYSYGLYLFAYPIQQTYALLLFPHLHWYINIAFTLTLGLLYAFVSWNLVEKRVLGQRKQIVAYVEGALRPAISILEAPFRRRTGAEPR